MRYLGFIKEIDKNIREAKEFKNLHSLSFYNEDKLQKIIAYLNSGYLFGAAMSYIYDFDKQPIGNLDYYTDGIYIWPSYFVFYIKKYPNFYIDETFVTYLDNNNYELKPLDKLELDKIDVLFSNEWSGKYTASSIHKLN